MPKSKDLIGQRFGNLIVISKNTDQTTNKKKCVRWNCLCDCGNMTIAKTEDLNSGKRNKCQECGRKNGGAKRRKNFTGNTYGHLKVVKMMYNYNKKNDTYCECECDCGNKNIIKNYSNLVYTNTIYTSCGCRRKEAAIAYKSDDITGQKFGRLTVVKMRLEFSPIKADCICDCGNVITVTKADLKSRHTQSCGCLQAERAGESNYIDLTGYISKNNIKAISPSHQNSHGVWIWNFECPLCNDIFQALPANVKSGKITSCGCSSSSKRELMIKNILDKYSIGYEQQYTFDRCKYINKLRFDFALFNDDESLNCLIEYDGEQHYISIDLFGGEEGLKLNQKRDGIKDAYCKDNDILLYRLKYDLSDEELENKVMNIIYPERLRQAV